MMIFSTRKSTILRTKAISCEPLAFTDHRPLKAMNVNRAIWTTLTVICALIGAIIGFGVASYYSQVKVKGMLPLPPTATGDVDILVPDGARVPLFIVLTLCFAVVFFRLGSVLGAALVGQTSHIHTLSPIDRVLGVIGALLGLIFWFFLMLPLASLASQYPLLMVLQFCILAVFVAMGVALMMGARSEILRVFPQLDSESEIEASSDNIPKLLDTNIIIDGRIAALCQTGFLEGPIWVPSFVLNEVQYIADSADSVRRAKGRRALEVLKEAGQIMVQKPDSAGKNAPMPLVRVMNEIPLSVKNIETVDAKLVALAKEIGAAIVTNDFNLKPIAELQGVRVLNLNELVQSLKPVVLPGEEIDLLLLKEGNHPGQAVGYLDDGTMIVVSDGAGHVGETCRVVITQLHQTLAGKMFFADMKDKGDDSFNDGHASSPVTPRGPNHSPSNGAHANKKRR